MKLVLNSNGYFYFNLYENNKHKFYSVSRFVFECFKGEIPSDKQADHIDNDRKNNSIYNLQLLTQAENTKKSHCKKVISFNIDIQEEKIFDSLKEVAEYHKLQPPTISMNCRKKNKITKSKKDGKRYQFFYL